MKTSIVYVSFDNVSLQKGATTHIHKFVASLTEKYEVTLISLGRENRSHDILINNRKATFHHIEIACPSENFLQRSELFANAVYRILKSLQFSVVHYRNIWEGQAIEELKNERPTFKTVFECNGLPSIELPVHYPALSLQMQEKLQFLEKQQIHQADLILTPSSQLMDHLIDSLQIPRAVALLPNGADETLFFPPATDSFKPARPSPTTSSFNLLYLGSLAPWQGLDLAMKALGSLRNRYSFKLLAVSPIKKIWMKKLMFLKKQYKLKNRFHIKTMSHEAIPPMIRQSHICLAPLTACPRNLIQGCSPLKVIEYMACGRAIIASNIPSVRDLITHNKTGYLVRPDSPQALKRAFIDLFENQDLRIRLGNQAATTFMNSFRWQRTTARLLDLYEKLIEGSLLSTNPSGIFE